MGRNPWVVEPETKRIELTWQDGAEARPLWLSVKRQLNVGEQRAMMRAVSTVEQAVARVRGAVAEAKAKIEWTEYSFARMAAYIVDWSLAHDPDPKARLAPTRESYDSLNPDVFQLIDDALDEHEKAEAERKKNQAGSPEPGATSA